MSNCTRCGAQFSCAMVDGAPDEPCWCTQLPAVLPMPTAAGSACWCLACLRQQIAQQMPASDASEPPDAAPPEPLS